MYFKSSTFHKEVQKICRREPNASKKAVQNKPNASKKRECIKKSPLKFFFKHNNHNFLIWSQSNTVASPESPIYIETRWENRLLPPSQAGCLNQPSKQVQVQAVLTWLPSRPSRLTTAGFNFQTTSHTGSAHIFISLFHVRESNIGDTSAELKKRKSLKLFRLKAAYSLKIYFHLAPDSQVWLFLFPVFLPHPHVVWNIIWLSALYILLQWAVNSGKHNSDPCLLDSQFQSLVEQ